MSVCKYLKRVIASRTRLKREVIKSANLPLPEGIPLSQGIKVGNVVYLSSMVAFNPTTMKIEGRTIEEQTRQSIKNCEQMLKAGGATLEDVVRVMVLLKRPGDFERMNKEYAKYFPRDPPARTVVKIGANLPNALISIMMTAVITGKTGEPSQPILDD